MKEHIEQLNHLSDVLYSMTRGKGEYPISRDIVKAWQSVLDELQEELDKVANELYRPE